MSYLQSLSGQIGIFCRTTGFGFLLGIGYDAVRLLRLLLAGGHGTAAWDISYAVLAAVCTFLYVLTQNGGEIRLYILLAELLGFAVWYILAAVPMRRCAAFLEKYIQRLRIRISRPVGKLYSKVQNRQKKCRASVKKIAKKSKFLLKFYHGLVYNLRQ